MSEDLNIIIPASTTEAAIYIDIPLKAVSSATIESQANSQSQSPHYALIIGSSENGEQKCCINAVSENHSSVALAFVSESDAQLLARLTHTTFFGKPKAARISVSEGISVSQKSNGQVSSPFAVDNQDETARISRTTPLMARKVTPKVVKSMSLSTTTAEHLVAASHDGSNGIGHGKSRTISVDFGVDVTQPGSINDKQTSLAPEIKATNVHLSTIRDHHTSDIGLSSSMQYQQGFEVTENAPEFRDKSDHPTEDHARIESPGQLAGPQISQTIGNDPNDQLSEHNSQSQHSLRAPTQESEPPPAESLHTDCNNNAFGIKRTAPARNPVLDVEMDVQAENDEPAHVNGRLCNDTGDIEMPLANPKSKRAAKGAKASIPPKKTLTAPKKTSQRVQKQTKTLKGAKITESIVKSAVPSFKDDNEIYDLQASPEASQQPATRITQKVTDGVKASTKTKPNQPTNRKPAVKTALAKGVGQLGREEDFVMTDNPELIENVIDDEHNHLSEPIEPKSVSDAKASTLQTTSRKPKPKTTQAQTLQTKQRPRREAAIKANAKIQGIKQEADEPSQVPDSSGETAAINLPQLARKDPSAASALMIAGDERLNMDHQGTDIA